MGLTVKQRKFIDFYLESGNATEAAKRAGYSEKSAANIGWENVRKREIWEEIQKRLQAKAMSVDEAVGILADFARGDIADFMDIGGMGFGVSLRDAFESGKTKLIKKVKQRTTIFLSKKESEEDREVHEIEIELHDPQTAIDKILRVAGAYITKHEITTKDWRTEVIELLKAGQLKPADVERELGIDLAAELFIAAGVPITSG